MSTEIVLSKETIHFRKSLVRLLLLLLRQCSLLVIISAELTLLIVVPLIPNSHLTIIYLTRLVVITFFFFIVTVTLLRIMVHLCFIYLVVGLTDEIPGFFDSVPWVVQIDHDVTAFREGFL